MNLHVQFVMWTWVLYYVGKYLIMGLLHMEWMYKFNYKKCHMLSRVPALFCISTSNLQEFRLL
jgi:hypothetical protein